MDELTQLRELNNRILSNGKVYNEEEHTELVTALSILLETVDSKLVTLKQSKSINEMTKLRADIEVRVHNMPNN